MANENCVHQVENVDFIHTRGEETRGEREREKESKREKKNHKKSE